MMSDKSEKTDSSLSVQQCWKIMLESPQQMTELRFNNEDTFSKGTDISTQSEEILIILEQDLQRISYSTNSKRKTQTTIEISSISNVLSAETLPKLLPEDQKSRSFSLVHRDQEFMFAAPSDAVAKCWILGLQRLVDNQTLMFLGTERRKEWFREVFRQYSSPTSHYLTFTDLFEKVLNSKHTTITQDFFIQKLKEFMEKKKMKYKFDGSFSTRDRFMEFYKYVFDRQEILNLFRRTASNGVFVTPSDLKYFLTKEQCMENVTLERCKEILRIFEVTQTGKENLELQIDGFTHYLLSRDGELFNEAHDQIYQDMTQPLPHYYIASSHNTYLCGQQLRGGSSAKAYTSVIEKGCRCVELDCWDGDDGEPIVYHGYTFTSKVPFKDIVEAINESAFKTSPYPLIMSLENHCSIESQKKMAKYLEEILGDKLYRMPVDASLNTFPSPEFFKYKILIRGKLDAVDEDNGDEGNSQEPEECSKQETYDKTMNEDDVKRKEKEYGNLSIKITPKSGNYTNPNSACSLPLVQLPGGSPSTRRRKSSTSKVKKKVAEELSDLINYITNSKFSSFDDSAKNGRFYQSSSFVESNMEYHVQNNAEDFIGYNRRQISRIYPGGLRIDSSNYEPQKPWNVGCQIVALNHQTNDEPMHLHYAKFRQNGKSGYILKPSFLRDPSHKFNPNTVRPNKDSKILKLTVLSGQQLPAQIDMWSFTKDEPDPYVQIQVHGVPADETTITTSIQMDNSFNPIWNESFDIKVLVPQLAMVRFSVFDKDIGRDDFIGQATFPFESIQQGYRHIPLTNMDNEVIPCASIFVHVIIEDLIKVVE